MCPPKGIIDHYLPLFDHQNHGAGEKSPGTQIFDPQGVVLGLWGGDSRESGGEDGVGVCSLEEEAKGGVPVDLSPCSRRRCCF